MQMFHLPNLSGAVNFEDADTVGPDFGIDEEGPSPPVSDSSSEPVIVNEPYVSISANQMLFIQQHFDPLAEDSNFGVETYVHLLNYVSCL